MTWASFGLIATVLIVIAFVGLRRDRRPPNILLITLDTTRADHIGAYGDRLAQTPRLDRLAREGVMFERALAAAPITLPAHVSLFTGQYPFVHGVRNNGDFALAERIPTLATALHDRGYRTAAFVSSFVLDRRYGLARGFDAYDDHLDSAADGAGALERRGDRTVAAAGEWLDAQTGGAAPFFLWIHLYDPHDPYDPPPPYRAQFADRPYDGEIAFDDAMIDGVLERLRRLGMLVSTAVAVVGDHGESLGEHEEATHSLFVYQATLRVPLILWWPGHLPAGQRVPSPVRGIDVAPTLLDLAGVRGLESAQGTTLLPRVRAANDGESAFASAYAETYFPLFYMNWAPLRSIQDERWKFIDAPEPELYDLSRDPQERSNLAAREPARVTALRRAVDALTGGNSGAMSARAVDADTAAKLAALGYVGAVGSGTTTAAHDGNRPDPKRMIGVFNRLREANAAAHDARHAEAETIARDALAGDPSNAFATIVLANAEMAQGRYAHAIADYRAYAALVPHSAEPHHRIAICYARLGEIDKALAEEDAAMAIDPRDPDVRNHRGGLLAARGRVDEAVAELRAAVEIVPDNAVFRVGLARVLLSAGRLDEADAELQHALRRAANSPDAHAAYGALLVARQRPDRAIEEFRLSLATRPEADDVRLDYAMALERVGRGVEARREYERLSSGHETPSDIRQAARARLQ